MTLKGGWGKRGSERLSGSLWGLHVEFWDNIFFFKLQVSTRGSQWLARIIFSTNGWGKLGRKGILGHNLGLGAQKRLASMPIVKK